MLGNLGFSYVGIIYFLMLMIPNLFWAKNKPKNYTPSNENRLLVFFERIGEISTTTCMLIFNNYDVLTINNWIYWFILSFILMFLYEICWLRYFIKGNTLEKFYGNFIGIPVPLATLPVIAILLLGIYGKVIWLIISIIVMGIGHIGIHINHAKDMNK
jgi:hypothetical protein